MSTAEWNTLSFPGLNISFPVYSTAFTIFGLQIKWYGILIAAGLLLALVYAYRHMKEVGIDGDRATDAIFFGLIGAIVGARLYYVIMSWDVYKYNIKEIFLIRDGGLAIYGGLIGALLFGIITCRIRKVKIMPILDLTGIGFLIGQGIGRWGNFFNHEAFGTNTTLPWGMTSPRIQSAISSFSTGYFDKFGTYLDEKLPVHPCFLYESLWCLIGFVLLALYLKHRKFDGEVFFMYIGWYGLGRFFIEGLRIDTLTIGHMRVSQLVAALCVIASVAVIIAIRSKIKRDGDYVFYRDTEESKQLIAETAEKYAQEEKKHEEKRLARKKKAEKVLSSEDKLVDEPTDEEAAEQNPENEKKENDDGKNN